jgi:hypothetical protein
MENLILDNYSIFVILTIGTYYLKIHGKLFNFIILVKIRIIESYTQVYIQNKKISLYTI